jgi:sensor histidine kinase YesM
MSHRLSGKLSAAYAALFSATLLATGLLTYSVVQREVTDTLRSNLDTTSDLIKRIVEINTENNWDKVEQNLALASEMLGRAARIRPEETTRVATYDDIREERTVLGIPALQMGDLVVSPGSAEARERIATVQRRTGGIVSIYVLTEDGYICAAGSLDGPASQRGVGYRIPPRSAFYTLISRGRTYIGREYFKGEWHLTAYLPLLAESAEGRDDSERGEPADGDTKGRATPQGPTVGGRRIVGALHVAVRQVDMDRLESDMNSIVIGDSGYSYIIDVGSNIVLHPTLADENLSIWPYIREITFSRNGHIRYFAAHEPVPHHFVATYKYIPPMNWIVVVGSSESDFFDVLPVLRFLLFVVYGVALVATVALSIVIGRRITKPVAQITEKIKEISEGEADLNRHLDVLSNDEIGELSTHFNTFIGKLRVLQEVESRETELQLRDAQMNALQAQINPHFLYNTLETIRFLISAGSSDAVRMVQNLADLLRVSIGKRERYTRLRQEIEHISLYLDIQRVRYPHKFSADIVVPEEVGELFVVKFMLQPLIENAIHHGFDQIESGGVIRVEAHTTDEQLRVTVSDNGSGIPRDVLARIQEHLEGAAGPGGIGIYNVHERLVLHFGDSARFSIESRLGVGTTVTITLPILAAQDIQHIRKNLPVVTSSSGATVDAYHIPKECEYATKTDCDSPGSGDPPSRDRLRGRRTGV